MAYGELQPIDEQTLAEANTDLKEKDRRSRQEAAVALRIAGATYSEIMRTLDYTSVTHARQAVERALASSVGDDDKKQARFIQQRRLDRLLRSVWADATSEEVEVTDPATGKKRRVHNENHLAYVRTALALIDRSIRLGGLDAPQEMVVYNPSNREVEEWIQMMVDKHHGDMPQEYDVIEGVKIGDDTYGDAED